MRSIQICPCSPVHDFAPQFVWHLSLNFFFIFTSVPILKKSCCKKNQIFAGNIIPSGKHKESSPLDRAPSTTVVLNWLNGAGTSQEVWSLTSPS